MCGFVAAEVLLDEGSEGIGRDVGNRREPKTEVCLPQTAHSNVKGFPPQARCARSTKELEAPIAAYIRYRSTLSLAMVPAHNRSTVF